MAGKQFKGLELHKNCVVIGSASLTLECIKTLHSSSYLHSVISTCPFIIKWCERRNIPCFSDCLEYGALNRQEAEVLFSIVNYKLLKDEFISSFFLAINYHDSLLPRYAGLHATTWAIYHGEKMHGISWHLMSQKIDEGNVLLAKSISISSCDTAHSLNLKCTSAAIDSFPELLECIKIGEINGTMQDSNLRTYYSKLCCIAFHALVFTHKTAKEIDRILRAFTMHPLTINSLSIPKIFFHKDIYLIKDAQVVFEKRNKTNRPLIKENENKIEIPIPNGKLILKELQTLYGKRVNFSKFAQESTVESPKKAILLNPSEYIDAKKTEHIWQEQLASFYFPNDRIVSIQDESNKHIFLTNKQVSTKKVLCKLNSIQKTISIFYSNKEILTFAEKRKDLFSFLLITTIENSTIQPLICNKPLLSDAFVRYRFNEENYPVIVLSETVNIFHKIPFRSFVYIFLDKHGTHIYEQNANLAIKFERTEFLGWKSLSSIFEKMHSELRKKFIFENDEWYSIDFILSQASKLSWTLKEIGINKSAKIGIGIPSGLHYFIAILGTVNIGAAYVPLDINHPKKRLNYILKDTEIKHILTTHKYKKTFNEESIFLVFIDTIRNSTSNSDDFWKNFQDTNLPMNIIYTSGTTGKPKGVVISQANVMHCLSGTLKLLNSTNQRFLAVTSTSFDIHLLDYLLPLCTDGDLIIASQEERRDGKQLLRLIEKHNITALQATPMTWRMLIESGWTGASNFLIICCGEPLTEDLAEQLQLRGKLFNLYGPTEATIYASGTQISDPKNITIGSEIDNTEILLLDSQLLPVCRGCIGQIAIAGPGVALEYLNQPQLTKEKFITYPLNPDRKIYLTGDFGKRLKNGNIEYCGRIDQQVKINGYRVEIQEIEEVLKKSDIVKYAIVLIAEEEDSKKIIAYIQPKSSTHTQTFQTTKLANHTKDILPAYMLPNKYIFVEKFPLLQSGKIDRNALLKKLPEQNVLQPNFSVTEKILAEIWKDLLKIKSVNHQDDFFSLGGNSLLAIKLVSSINRKWNLDFEYITIFELTTIKKQSQHIDNYLCETITI